jgi:UDP-glucose 4-epimerase
MTNGTILVTGGCGYIGTHTITVLLEQGYNVVIVDNLSNASSVSLDRVTEICKLSEEERAKRLIFHQVDVCDEVGLRKVFESSPTFTSCIHFAGLKVGHVYFYSILLFYPLDPIGRLTAFLY